MNKDIFAKFINQNYVEQELVNIGFDSTYRHHACLKNTYKTVKVFNLRPQEASILKQSALSLGFDAAVHRGVLDCSVELSDALLTGSIVQFEKLALSLKKQPFKMKQVAENILSLITNELSPLKIKNKIFDWERPYIMGIVNVTPNSFSDGGSFFNVDDAINHIKELIDDGADVIDIGAESTHPNNKQISYEEEISRLKPVLKELKNIGLSVPVSIDTRNVKTAEFAIENGANIINDVGFSDFNEEMIAFVNQNNIPYIYTHNRAYDDNFIDNVFNDFLIANDKITTSVIFDVGIGFGKSINQNYELLKRISEFKSFNIPLLVGHSRKSFLSKTFELSTIEDLDEATVLTSAQLVKEGVNILRVHNVKIHKFLIDLYSKFC